MKRKEEDPCRDHIEFAKWLGRLIDKEYKLFQRRERESVRKKSAEKSAKVIKFPNVRVDQEILVLCGPYGRRMPTM